MRIKQTARKSTGTRDQRPDPLRGRMGRLLETKRNSATFTSGSSTNEQSPHISSSTESTSSPSQEDSQSSSSATDNNDSQSSVGPGGIGKGNLGRGKGGVGKGGVGRGKSGFGKSEPGSSGGRRDSQGPPRYPGRGKQLPSAGRPGVKSGSRLKNGQGALREIRALQKTTNNLIPKAPFHRLVREITQSVSNEEGGGRHEIRYQTMALEALQEATETYLIRLFEDSYLCALHARRVTLFTKDIELCRRLRHN